MDHGVLCEKSRSAQRASRLVNIYIVQVEALVCSYGESRSRDRKMHPPVSTPVDSFAHEEADAQVKCQERVGIESVCWGKRWHSGMG
jgi:hypothetical protein